MDLLLLHRVFEIQIQVAKKYVFLISTNKVQINFKNTEFVKAF